MGLCERAAVGAWDVFGDVPHELWGAAAVTYAVECHDDRDPYQAWLREAREQLEAAGPDEDIVYPAPLADTAAVCGGMERA